MVKRVGDVCSKQVEGGGTWVVLGKFPSIGYKVHETGEYDSLTLLHDGIDRGSEQIPHKPVLGRPVRFHFRK